MTEYHPKILEAVKDVLNIVGQHYEQAKTSTEEIKSSVRSIPSAIPLPAIAAPMPSPELPKELPLPDKYDDTDVHLKLDRLVRALTRPRGNSDAQFELLERIQAQVAESASQFSDFIASHRTLTDETHESKAKEAEETALALQQRLSQKEFAEADIVNLSNQKSILADEIGTLRSEKDSLLAQKIPPPRQTSRPYIPH